MMSRVHLDDDIMDGVIDLHSDILIIPRRHEAMPSSEVSANDGSLRDGEVIGNF